MMGRVNAMKGTIHAAEASDPPITSSACVTNYAFEDLVCQKDEDVFLDRTCSACGHQWQTRFTINVRGVAGEGGWGGEVTAPDPAKALKSYHEDRRTKLREVTKNVTKDVVCPKCSQFCMRTKQIYFPNGMVDWLTRSTTPHLRIWLAVIGISGGISLLGISALALAKEDVQLIVKQNASLLWVWVLSNFVAASTALALIELWTNRRSFRSRLKTMTEEEAHEFLLERYRKHDGELRHLAGEDFK